MAKESKDLSALFDDSKPKDGNEVSDAEAFTVLGCGCVGIAGCIVLVLVAIGLCIRFVMWVAGA